MGALDYLSNFCTVTNTRTKQKAMQTTEIKVRMDCDGCERRVRNAVSSIKGVKSVEVNRKESRVVVRGYVDPKKVLKRGWLNDEFPSLKSMMQRQLEAENESIGFIYQEQNISGIRI
ncbi:Heavy metal-associated isoprenylated plant protein 20 [Glycine max]|nr:Heavy metal-associated isoprenylated plant protein 20 [Glycine max]